MSEIPLVDSSEMSPSDADVLSSLPFLNIYRFIGNVPGVLEPWTTLVSTVYHFSLGDRLREVAILRLVNSLGSAYATHQHQLLSHNIGLTPQEIDAITAQKPVTALSESENRICDAADQIAATGTWTDTMRDALIAHFGVKQTSELLLTFALYNAVSVVTRASNIPIEAHSPLTDATDPHGH